MNTLIEKSYGNVHVVRGKNHGRFPYCNTILITGKVNAVIDPGAGEKILGKLSEKYRIDIVIDTHYHFDHIWFNYLFRDAEIHLNKHEAPCFRSLDTLAERLGILEVYGVDAVKRWKQTISSMRSEAIRYTPQNRHEWILSTSRLNGEYEDGKIFDFGNTEAEAMHLPGHTAGFCCFYFPSEKLVYTADIDLTSFGPWYGESDVGIQEFLDSMDRITELDADIYVTGHEMGIVTKSEFLSRLEEFKSRIFERDKDILKFLRSRKNGATLNEITSQGLIYGKKFLVDEWLYMWEKIMVKKHLMRLEKLGFVCLEADKYSMKKG